MSGDPFAEEFGAGGPSDDGVGVAGWQLSHRLDGARGEYAAAVRDEAVSPLLAVLLARLRPSAGGGVR
ncbi:hypothetical protein AB0H18_00630 [Streptomyces sp. NPDC020766]|uniref:hypothetical protein n=1 Tax=Streptomyces sp. NPDC020766 TaxID=3155011 RepID=UPI0033F758EB